MPSNHSFQPHFPTPFGSVMLGRDFRGGKYRFGFTGLECDNEFGNTYHTENREFNTKNAVWFSIDPLFRNFPSFSPYNYIEGNPILFNDRTGKSKESTHTDKDGNVIAVKIDGDYGVYKHSGDFDEATKHFQQNYSLDNTSANARKFGETFFQDEFIPLEKDGEKIVPRILENTSFDGIIDTKHQIAMNYNLYDIGKLSKNGKDLDIKVDKIIAPHGVYTGRMLDGKYVTARSAGNYLAGYNGRTGTILGVSPSRNAYMAMAGALQKTGSFDVSTAASVLSGLKIYGPAPYYGEIPYTGRMIDMGWNSKRK